MSVYLQLGYQVYIQRISIKHISNQDLSSLFMFYRAKTELPPLWMSFIQKALSIQMLPVHYFIGTDINIVYCFVTQNPSYAIRYDPLFHIKMMLVWGLNPTPPSLKGIILPLRTPGPETATFQESSIIFSYIVMVSNVENVTQSIRMDLIRVPPPLRSTLTTTLLPEKMLDRGSHLRPFIL